MGIMKATEESLVRAEIVGHTGLLTLTRDKALNALNRSMYHQLVDALQMWRDDPAITEVVVRSELPKAFCAGGDIRALRDAAASGDHAANREFFSEEYEMDLAYHTHRVPTVAVIHGVAMGGGLGISINGSHRVVTKKVMMAMPETAIDFFTDVGASWFLPRVTRGAGATIDDDAWTTINYTDAIFDEHTNRWISRAEVAEVDFTAFTSKPKNDQVPGRLVVRRIPDFRPEGDGLFDVWRFHAFFTTSDLDTVTADKTHRAHAVIEQVHADLKASALAHLPSGKFCANAAWLVCAVIAFNLTRAAASLSGGRLAKATTSTVRRTLICIPARIASSARRITMHLPARWPWETEWNLLFDNTIHRRPPTWP